MFIRRATLVVILLAVLACSPVAEGSKTLTATAEPAKTQISPTASTEAYAGILKIPFSVTAEGDYIYARWCDFPTQYSNPKTLCHLADRNQFSARPSGIYYSSDGLVFLQPHGTIVAEFGVRDTNGSLWAGYNANVLFAVCESGKALAHIDEPVIEKWSGCLDVYKEKNSIP